MGFNRVYKSLQEIFPQIDARALRAVAIEHSKDADAAVEAVLVEIIPFFSEKLKPRSPLSASTSMRESPPAAVVGAVATTKDGDGPGLNTVGSVDVINGHKVDGENQKSFHDADDGKEAAFSDTNGGHNEREGNTAELALSRKTDENCIKLNTDDCSNTVGSVDVINGHKVDGENQKSFHDADDGKEAAFSDTNGGHNKREGNTAELALSKKTDENCIKLNTDDCSNTVGSVDVINGHKVDGENQKSFHDADDGKEAAFSDTNGGHNEREGNTAELALSKKTDENCIKLNTDDCSNGEILELIDKNGINTLQIEVSGDPQTQESVRAVKCPKDNTRTLSDGTPCETLETLQEVDMGFNWNKDRIQGNGTYDQLETKLITATNKEYDQVKFCVDVNNSMVESASLMVHDPSPSPLGNSVPVIVNIPSGGNEEKLNAILLTNTASNVDNNGRTIDTEDESIPSSTMIQSGQNQIVDVLDEILADARSHKSLITLMREVELKEQAAELAKDEAAMSGTDILVKVEELGQKLQHAKDANDTRAAEVYGEKAILSTELRELQSRVLALSDERDKSLAVLEEMRQSLEVRLAAIENEVNLAEQEKVEKEHTAAKALAEQELIMEKVVQESKILKKQAEDNAMLLEFLVDRGRVVDTLQGEIAVICQDVRILKEKFDERVPFSKSLSSSHTSFVLASSSSSSSSKSLITEQVELVPVGAADPFETENKGDFISCSDEQSCEEKGSRDDREALLEDGWEIFDNRDAYA